MNESHIAEIAERVMSRNLKLNPELLTNDEMSMINRTDIIKLARKLSAELSFEIQWYYYENRKRTNQQLLREVDEQIKDFEEVYGTDFENEFGNLSLMEADSRDDASNYYDWLELLERRKRLFELISEEKNK